MPRPKNPTGLEPHCVALLLCDVIHVDPVSSRYTLLGLFTEVDAVRFPMVYPKFSVYAAVADGRGVTPIVLQMVDVNEKDDPIWTYKTEVDFSDPQRVQEIGVEIRESRFPKPGIYRLQ